MSERAVWAWENIYYGGTIRWQLHCRWGVAREEWLPQ
jgi:hypothetical protein